MQEEPVTPSEKSSALRAFMGTLPGQILLGAVTMVLIAGVVLGVQGSLPGLFDADRAGPSAARASGSPAPSPSGAQGGGPAAADDAAGSVSGKSDGKAADGGLEAQLKARDADLANLAQLAEKANKRLATPPVAEFTVATFNVLGHSHTKRGGDRKGWAQAGTRIRWAADLIRSHGVEVIALQEFQPGQSRDFARVAGEYDQYPPAGSSTDNSVAWRRDAFELVQPGSRSYPYFGGRPKDFPQILLRHKATGVQFYITSYHNPANTGGSRSNNEGHKARAAAMQAANAAALVSSTQRPVILAGDMNARADYFCQTTGRAPLKAANGGSNAGGCRPPARMSVDWLMGSPKVAFSGYLADQSGFVRRTSDHPLVLAQARVTGKRSDRNQADDPASGSPTD